MGLVGIHTDGEAAGAIQVTEHSNATLRIIHHKGTATKEDKKVPLKGSHAKIYILQTYINESTAISVVWIRFEPTFINESKVHSGLVCYQHMINQS